MCFAGPSMGNNADADQMSPDVALHLGLYLYPKLILHAWRYSKLTVYFESQTDRVLIYVEFTAVIVLKYRGILSLDCLVLDIFRCFSSHSLKFSVIIYNAVS